MHRNRLIRTTIVEEVVEVGADRIKTPPISVRVNKKKVKSVSKMLESGSFMVHILRVTDVENSSTQPVPYENYLGVFTKEFDCEADYLGLFIRYEAYPY